MKDVLGKMEGFTGADIEAVCREAALIAMRAGKKKVTKTHFEEAIGRVRPRSPRRCWSTTTRWSAT